MILGPSGQNIYPEEVETVINSQPYVVDSLVIEDNGGLTALIYPDVAQGAKDGIRQRDFQKYFDERLPELNKELPNYAKLKKIEIMSEDFERTPKKSIKRYLYQRS
jgi:long-chain acyl-CoA synthetase